jgi:hypothetical protein
MTPWWDLAGRQETIMRRTYQEAVAHYLEAHRARWVDGLTLARVGGAYAWRTRVSECRQHRGMRITQRTRRLRSGRLVSEYRYEGPA